MQVIKPLGFELITYTGRCITNEAQNKGLYGVKYSIWYEKVKEGNLNQCCIFPKWNPTHC